MKQAEKAVHLGIAYDLICTALEHLEEVSKAEGSIGVGVISDTMPVIEARDFVLKMLCPALKGCGLVEIEEARIKIKGE